MTEEGPRPMPLSSPAIARVTEQEHLDEIQQHARDLAAAVHAAEEDGVSPALVLPALFQVFQEAGMLPDGLDLGGMLGMVTG